jgi:regulator of RNase E activity RraA
MGFVEMSNCDHQVIETTMTLRLAQAPRLLHFSRASRLALRSFRSLSSSTSQGMTDLLSTLRKLDTACLCDADKSIDRTSAHQPLSLLEGLRPLALGTTVAGVARTVQFSEPNDFLAVLDGLAYAQQDDILVVNTLDSNRAVAGELFCAESARRGVQAIIVDGPMRDTKYLPDFPTVRCWSRSVTPYSGTVNILGKTQVQVNCGGVQVYPSNIIVGDDDGIICAPARTFEAIIPLAREIQAAEERIRKAVTEEGKSLHSMTNYKDHVEAIRKGQASSLQFL